LAEHELFATGTTGTLIMGETKLDIYRYNSGPEGGDQQIGAMLAKGELDLIIFLRDPLTAQPHEPDVSALLRLCDVPVAKTFQHTFLSSPLLFLYKKRR
ncbi:MAG: methylglyoxal synthase, partial [Clostridia bacterium]|nr:methylglyoxal synthase [Clostridia bacterium]